MTREVKPLMVLAAVDADLAELVAAPGSAGLRATARVLAGVLDSEAPATAKVQAAKTLTDVLVRLSAQPQGAGDGDGVDRLRRGGARRRGAASER